MYEIPGSLYYNYMSIPLLWAIEYIIFTWLIRSIYNDTACLKY